MDVAGITLQDRQTCSFPDRSRSVPVQCDPGLLAAFDTSPVDEASYANVEPHLLSLTLHSTQSLLSALFSLPTTPSEVGPVAQLPDPITLLPREKPLPKPKPLTKWERFAKAKGISHKTKEKKVWDDERQDWVNRWGKDGKNRDGEEQWLHEIRGGQDPNADPRKAARDERKARVGKNERQHQRNLAEAARTNATTSSSVSSSSRGIPAPSSSQAAKAAARQARKSELERSMLVSSTSTASMGKFDKKIEGEPKARGVKRKFESNVTSGGVSEQLGREKEKAMSVLARLGVEDRKKEKVQGGKKGGEGIEGGVNVRKAVRYHERAQRAAAAGARGVKGGKGGQSGRGEKMQR